MGNYEALLAKSPAFFAEQAGYEDERVVPPMWLLDKLAEEKLTGKYNTHPSNICDGCFLARSVNGTCGC